MRIFVINLDYRPEKWYTSMTNIQNTVMNNYKVERFSAINGFDLSLDLRFKNLYNDPIIPIIQKTNIMIGCGVIGCLLSHYYLLRQISRDESISDNELVLILEDDFFIGSDFNSRFLDLLSDIKDDMDMIYPGGRFHINFEPTDYSIFTHIYSSLYQRPTTFSIGSDCNIDRTTHAQFVRKRFASKLADYICQHIEQKNCVEEIDSFIYGTIDFVPIYDSLPHLFYSPINVNSDIQPTKEIIKIQTSTI